MIEKDKAGCKQSNPPPSLRDTSAGGGHKSNPHLLIPSLIEKEVEINSVFAPISQIFKINIY
jgi:hypothetical protein